MCNSEESVIHLLGECPVSRQVFQGVGIQLNHSSHMQEWKTKLANSFISMDESKRVFFIITCWTIWSNRNKIHHNGGSLMWVES